MWCTYGVLYRGGYEVYDRSVNLEWEQKTVDCFKSRRSAHFQVVLRAELFISKPENDFKSLTSMIPYAQIMFSTHACCRYIPETTTQS